MARIVLIGAGSTVFAGVDYERILRLAEAEADGCAEAVAEADAEGIEHHVSEATLGAFARFLAKVKPGVG